MMLILVLFGISIAGGLLAPLSWADALAGLAVLLIVRPLAGLAGLAGAAMPFRERAVIGFFGIRGIGSFYYLAYALNEASFPAADRLWAITGFIVLVSILLHGMTVTPIIGWMDRARDQEPGSSLQGEQRGVAARGGGIDAERSFVGEPAEVVGGGRGRRTRSERGIGAVGEQDQRQDRPAPLRQTARDRADPCAGSGVGHAGQIRCRQQLVETRVAASRQKRQRGFGNAGGVQPGDDASRPRRGPGARR